jgi:cytochrome c oxidase assembly protein subunit 11
MQKFAVSPSASARRRFLTPAIVSGGVALVMLGASFAAAPLYDAFCRLTGFGGATQVASGAPKEVLARSMEVRFDANVAPGLAIEFKPDEVSRTLHIGETGLAFYRLINHGERPVRIVATYNVQPDMMGPYFMKLECFCFEPRTVQPGEALELPVVFFVDPQIEDRRLMDQVESVTLSYTFFEAKDGALPQPSASAPGPVGATARRAW